MPASHLIFFFYHSKMSKIFALSDNPEAICPFVSVGKVKTTLFCYIYTNFAMLEHAIQLKFEYLLDVRYAPICIKYCDVILVVI